MKNKRVSEEEDDPLDREFDFSKARPNPYFVDYHGPRVIRVLEPDLADIFPDHSSVNAALRVIAKAVAQTTNTAAPAPKKEDQRPPRDRTNAKRKK